MRVIDVTDRFDRIRQRPNLAQRIDFTGQERQQEAGILLGSKTLMPATFQIFPEANLVYVRYSGMMRVEDSFAAFDAYVRHPDARSGQRHLIDLRHITDMEHDYTSVMQLQAHKGESLALRETETLMVYLASNPISLKAAALAKNGWSRGHGVVALVQETETAALAALGLNLDSIAALMDSDPVKRV